ncbi:hypothetical protein GCM10022234_00330 [Aeromicrobium panaciterrae]|uniref:hypothetical protein n=1 Tax=Aeromicrobium panaciterrae TaxID=363861 RepID=UPI0031D94073
MTTQIPSDLTCVNCSQVNLDEMACPNDRETCVECCPCHKDDDKPTVVVGVIEWGSNYDDRDPEIIVGTTVDVVRLAAYRETLDFASQGDPDLPAPSDLPDVDETDPASVAEWLALWHDETTAAWLTIETLPVLGSL